MSHFFFKVEHDCWAADVKTQKVPAQRIIDFVEENLSSGFPKTSYFLGLTSVDLDEVLPEMLFSRLKAAFVAFGNKMKGCYTNEAVFHAPRSSMSSPVCIPRDPVILRHVEIKGLYPCAEGAGYAGGIISAAIDGINCMDRILES